MIPKTEELETPEDVSVAREYVKRARKILDRVVSSGLSPDIEGQVRKLTEDRADYEDALENIEDEEERQEIEDEVAELLAAIRTNIANKKKRMAAMRKPKPKTNGTVKKKGAK